MRISMFNGLCLGAIVAASPGVEPGHAMAAAGGAPAQCPVIHVDRAKLPLALTLFRIAGGAVQQAGSVATKSLPAQINLEDCGDASFLGYTSGGQFYLVRRSEIAFNTACTCLAKSERVAGVAGAGELPACKPPC